MHRVAAHSCCVLLPTFSASCSNRKCSSGMAADKLRTCSSSHSRGRGSVQDHGHAAVVIRALANDVFEARSRAFVAVDDGGQQTAAVPAGAKSEDALHCKTLTEIRFQ